MGRKAVAIVIHAGVQALDVAGPMDVFAEANRVLPEEEQYDCRLIARDTTPLQSSGGLLLSAHLSFAQAGTAFHTVLVAGGAAMTGNAEDDRMIGWLQQACPHAVRYGAICTGAFTLGRAGLLTGRTVTTHWRDARQLALQFPDTIVEPDRIHVRDGPLVTSAGVTAGIDLALALIGEDHGEKLSLHCARQLVVVAQRQGGQSQFSPLLMPGMAPASPLGLVHSHVMAHPAETFPVRRLATLAGVSPRTLTRLFASELGMTPHDYVESIRLDRARNLLEGTPLPIKVVAFDCGFTGPAQMRAIFRKRLGLSPLQYRASFQVVREKQPPTRQVSR